MRCPHARAMGESSACMAAVDPVACRRRSPCRIEAAAIEKVSAQGRARSGRNSPACVPAPGIRNASLRWRPLAPQSGIGRRGGLRRPVHGLGAGALPDDPRRGRGHRDSVQPSRCGRAGVDQQSGDGGADVLRGVRARGMDPGRSAGRPAHRHFPAVAAPRARQGMGAVPARVLRARHRVRGSRTRRGPARLAGARDGVVARPARPAHPAPARARRSRCARRGADGGGTRAGTTDRNAELADRPPSDRPPAHQPPSVTRARACPRRCAAGGPSVR